VLSQLYQAGVVSRASLNRGLQSQSAFELSRWRDGRCCMGVPLALMAV